MRSRLRGDDGSMSLELVIIAPFLIIFLLFIADIGRLSEASGQIQGAARDAARAASVQRGSAGQYDAAAQVAATADLVKLCPDATATPSGGNTYQDGTVIAYTVHCDVPLIAFMGSFGTKHWTATAAAPLETFRRAQ